MNQKKYRNFKRKDGINYSINEFKIEDNRKMIESLNSH